MAIRYPFWHRQHSSRTVATNLAIKCVVFVYFSSLPTSFFRLYKYMNLCHSVQKYDWGVCSISFVFFCATPFIVTMIANVYFIYSLWSRNYIPPTTTLPWRALNFSTSINIMTRRMQKLSFEADLSSTTILKHAINKLPYSKEFKWNQMETRQTDLCCEKKIKFAKVHWENKTILDLSICQLWIVPGSTC